LEGQAATGALQLPADTQEGIANRFGIQAPHLMAPEQLIAGITCYPAFRIGGSELVNASEGDAPNQALQRPAILDEARCQVIQQMWMNWRLPREAKIIGTLDNRTTDHMPPNTIHKNARDQAAGS